jgi:NAD+ synthase (glutamine-hydrolysing)
VLEIRGKVFGLAICEDLWEDSPSEKLAAANIEAVISLNASPFHKGKLAERHALLARRAKQLGVPLIYANLIGGQDELVFDGGSFAVDGTGEVVIQLPQFEEATASLSIAEDGRVVPRQLEHTPQLSVPAQVYSALVLGVRDYVQKNGFKSVVLGLSGGIDSALTLAIAVDALGSEAVNAVMMPYEYTSQLSLEAAAEQAATLGVAYRSIPIKEMVESFSVALAGEFDGYAADVTEQNLQARCRGVLLMAISNKKGHLVLTTGNKSEIAVGYSTLYGDMAGGFDVLKDVSKGLVYQLSRYRNETHTQAGLEGEAIPVAVIERPPSAELAPGQVDQDNLPDYDTLDRILELYIEQDVSAQGIIAAGFDENQVKRVLRLVDVNEYKRRQSAIGPRITPRGFGRDRRYPITNGWTIGD